MNDFQVTVELDSPLLLSGAQSGKKVDPAHMIRPASVRGLMHTFARALFGPLLGSAPKETRKAERRLLGAQGGVEIGGHEVGATFRLEVVPSRFANTTNFPNCPHDPNGKGRRKGFNEGQTATLVLRPRPRAVRADAGLPAILWTVLWTGFAFGALGNRSRRGYGSITLTGVQGINGGTTPDLGALFNNGGQDVQQTLPTWQEIPADRAALARGLCSGLRTARAAAAAWLDATGTTAAPTGAPSFFQLFGPDWVYIGKVFDSSDEAMRTLMNACSNTVGTDAKDRVLFCETLGAPVRFPNGMQRPKDCPDRFASPLWVRLYRTSEGWVPVATFSGDPTQRSLVDQVLGAIGASEQTLRVVESGGGC